MLPSAPCCIRGTRAATHRVRSARARDHSDRKTTRPRPPPSRSSDTASCGGGRGCRWGPAGLRKTDRRSHPDAGWARRSQGSSVRVLGGAPRQFILPRCRHRSLVCLVPLGKSFTGARDPHVGHRGCCARTGAMRPTFPFMQSILEVGWGHPNAGARIVAREPLCHWRLRAAIELVERSQVAQRRTRVAEKRTVAPRTSPNSRSRVHKETAAVRLESEHFVRQTNERVWLVSCRSTGC